MEEILQAQEVPETTTAPESRFGSKVNRPQLLEGRGEEPDRESPLVIGNNAKLISYFMKSKFGLA